ncbi:MAG: CheR family methyltransferase [Alphaproteobacteria bacterium]|nr:CheR family methyltransferase [Alphaproteobacteria bacterium]
MGDLEATLEELTRVMDAHRRALAQPMGGAEGDGATSAPPPESARKPTQGDDPTPAADSPRAAALSSLMAAVQARIGLKALDTVSGKLERALSSLDDAAVTAWVERMLSLSVDHAEWVALAESLTVHESYLFRDPQQLEAIRHWLGDQVRGMKRRGEARSLRLWSAGCAAGEEVYTLALLGFAVLQAEGAAIDSANDGWLALPNWGLDVLGTDLSRAVLKTAETGIYNTGRLSAFRDLPAAYERFFGPGPVRSTRMVRADVRRVVRFRPANLLAPAPERGFDVVACRNVLIYMDAASRQTVLRHLIGALRPGGLLALGPTDVLAEPAGVTALGGSAVGLFRKGGGDG